VPAGKTRKPLRSFGPWGKRVLVVEDGDLIRVEWRENGRRRRRSWDKGSENRKVAIAWAKGKSDNLLGMDEPQPVTVRQLWDQYIEAQTHLRSRTVQLYAYRWRMFERFVRQHRLAVDVSAVTLDSFRKALKKRGIAANQRYAIVQMVQIVFNWAEQRELIDRNPVGRYRFKRSKDEHKHKPTEYRTEEFERILAQWNPQFSREWRPWAVTCLIGHQGTRENAALHLRWEDVDLAEGWITWPAQFDKVGREWQQPIRAGARSALFTASEWRERDHYQGPWVFYSSWEKRRKRDKPYGAQAYWKALRDAEKRAGVEHQKYRSAHGFRKMVVGEITKLTGNPVYALQFVGDRDLKQANTYIIERPDELVAIAEELDR
jgi:integrase